MRYYYPYLHRYPPIGFSRLEDISSFMYKIGSLLTEKRLLMLYSYRCLSFYDFNA